MVSLSSELVAPFIPAEVGVDSFTPIYDTWFQRVLHWLRAFGVTSADLEDQAQEVFVVVQRKLVDFDGRNLAGWLYRIAARTASDYRRRAWFRNLFHRVDSAEGEKIGVSSLELLEQRSAHQVLEKLLAQLSAKRRVVLVLHEVEGYTTDEIAALENLPVATVRTRLHYARKDFDRLATALRRPESH
jgi:RNA polymerase sigma-70 factor (ECF subfamily)